MEISHLIGTFLCGSYTDDESYTQFESFDVLLNFADGSVAYLWDAFRSSVLRERTVNHA